MLFLLIGSVNVFAFKGDSLRAIHDKPTQKKNDDTVSLVSIKNISFEDLTYLVDSLLDLDTVKESDIKLVNHYAVMLHLVKTKAEGIPAPDFYEAFDEEAVFTITPETDFPDTQTLLVQSDSLGNYYHPRLGIVTSKFGWRDNRMHKGIDIHLNKGDTVRAAFNGMVRIARKQGAYGNVVIIRHYNGLETVYAHLSKIKVKVGQVINSGELLGLGGSTGRSSGPHLHFEVRFKGQALNPSNFISFTDGKMEADSLMIKKGKSAICAYPSNATLYTIEKGDSWYEIAKRFGITVKQLCALNGVEKKYYLRTGQKLRIQ
ncbi:MAG TPA: M23 family metallopeptidase [Bacteroidia bacterium]